MLICHDVWQFTIQLDEKDMKVNVERKECSQLRKCATCFRAVALKSQLLITVLIYQEWAF